MFPNNDHNCSNAAEQFIRTNSFLILTVHNSFQVFPTSTVRTHVHLLAGIFGKMMKYDSDSRKKLKVKERKSYRILPYDEHMVSHDQRIKGRGQVEQYA